MPRTIAKPAGLPVFPPHDDPDGACVLRVLLDEQPWRAALPWPDGFEGGVAHRLDTSTSGALLVADDPDELALIRDAFGSGRLRKTYRMRASKDVAWDDNACDRPLAHDRRHKKRMIVQRGPSTPHRGAWYPAHTRFHRVEGRLWEVEITTGVMHQIRAHAAFVGLPILGDALYGGGATPDGSPEGVRFFLHHVGLTDGDALHTSPVPLPDWAR
jgi:23S rRNA pseudouridine1911/1915/1917 synthase